MKIKTLLFTLLILLFGTLTVDASQLPKEVKDYLSTQKTVPTVRFDGIVVYNNDIMYLPVYPAYPNKVEKLQIVKTYPLNSSMDKYPDMVLFNNNFALLKIIRVGENTLSVRNLEEWPNEIKTGLIPQDIMVPRGLVLPDSLAMIVGDIQIPLVGSAKSSSFITRKNAPLPTGKRITKTNIANVPSALRNKLFYVNNFQTEYLQVFSSTVSEPLFSLKTSGVVKDLKPILGGKYLLAATNNKKNVDVIDVKNEYIVKNIDLTANPSEIIVDDTNNKAYIASVSDESLTIVDLNSLTVKEKIQLLGAPQRLSLNEDGSAIAYVDMKTSNVYLLNLNGEYENKLITNFPNATKIILKHDVLYLITRTKPALRVVYYDLMQDNQSVKSRKERKREEYNKEQAKKDSEFNADIITQYESIKNSKKLTEEEILAQMKLYSTSIKDIDISPKPVDMYQRGDTIYVLCAGDNTVYTYNTVTGDVSSVELSVSGFSKAFSPVPNSDLAVITNVSDLKYAVYDMSEKKQLQTVPISDYINMITILDRYNGN